MDPLNFYLKDGLAARAPNHECASGVKVFCYGDVPTLHSGYLRPEGRRIRVAQEKADRDPAERGLSLTLLCSGWFGRRGAKPSTGTTAMAVGLHQGLSGSVRNII